jgi:hypothetical protein
MPTLDCNLCCGPFDLDQEGGRIGKIGEFITFAFCPTCLAGIMDWAEQEISTYDPDYLKELCDGWKEQTGDDC